MSLPIFFKEKLFEILTDPLVKAIGENKNTQMIFTGLPEAFFTYLKVSLIAGIVVATPVIFYEFWMFVSPGLYRNEKKYMLPVVVLSLVLSFMARMGLVGVPFLRKNRKYAVLIIFTVTAVLTPGPDVISQLIMAGPLMILYEIGIIGAWVFGKKTDTDTIEKEGE